MKILSITFLFLFVSFLATPTIIGFVDDKVDTSYFYNMCEEEENHAPFNEIKSIPVSNYSFLNFSLNKSVKLNVFIEHNLIFSNLAHQIFSPPPNFI